MKNINYLFSVFTIISLMGCNEQNTNISENLADQEVEKVEIIMPKTGWEISHLKGKVQSMSNILYHPVLENGIIKSGEVFDIADGNYKISYNELGYVKETIYYSDKLNVVRTEKSIMGDNGYNIGSEIYDNENNLFASVEILYDEEGRLFKMITTVGQTKITASTTYDTDNNPTMLELSRANGEIYHIIKSTFNDYGLISSKTSYGENNEFISEELLIYDDNKNHIESKFEFSENSSSQVVTYEYEFDHQGNWIKQIVFNSEGVAVQVVERTFEYYE